MKRATDVLKGVRTTTNIKFNSWVKTVKLGDILHQNYTNTIQLSAVFTKQ